MAEPAKKPEAAAKPAQGGAAATAEPTPQELKGQKIGRVLTRMGKVTSDQVKEALAMQSQRRMPLGQLLIELGYVNEDDVNRALAAQAGMTTIDLDSMKIPDDVIHLLPKETAIAYQVVPIAYEKETNTLTVAMKSADNFRAMDDLHLLMGFKVKPVISMASEVEKAIDKFYGDEDESLLDLINAFGDDADLEEIDSKQSIDLETLVQMAEDNKVKRLMNVVLLEAIKARASDVHFEPFEHEFKMRYRIDGVLYEMVPPPKQLAMPIVSRVKVMAQMDIAERRVPQDGRIELQMGGRPIDLRVATLPTMFGESVVMRILDRNQVNLDLEKVGLRDEDLGTVRQLIRKPNGIVIVTGPTGSGKTTTLYSALNELNENTEKICTAEDPVEYDIEGLIQVQVNPAVGLTFAAALRSFLRQDPDIILVGETRDLETARIGVQASLTGHLVLTTLHTNDAPSTVARLLDLGLEHFLITATMEGVIAQRLVRRICPKCKSSFEPTEEQLMELAMTPDDLAGRKLFRGRGCDYCNNTGYKGRLGLFEIMVINDEIRELVMQSASTTVIRETGRKHGMRTLREAGLLAMFDGDTSLDEIVKETIVEN